MKKGLNYLLATLLLGGLFTLHSCGGEDVPPVLVVTSLSSGFDASTDTFTGTPGDELVLDISVDAEDVFKNLTITKSDGSSLLSEEQAEDKQTAFSTSYTYALTEAEIGSDMGVTITATDDNDATVSQSIGIVTNSVPVAVNKYTATLLSAPTGDETSQTFYSTNGEGRTWSYKEVNGTTDPISETIDVCYRFGEQDGAVLSSPSVYFIYSELKGWGTKNETLFEKTSMETSHFGMIENNDDLLSHWAMAEVNDADGDAVGLKVGDIVAVQLATSRGGKKGFILVTSLVEGDGSDGKIGIELILEGE